MSLAQAMKERGFTDETLAARVGVSRVFITRIRNRRRQPSMAIAAKLVELTGVDPSDLVKEDAPSNHEAA